MDALSGNRIWASDDFLGPLLQWIPWEPERAGEARRADSASDIKSELDVKFTFPSSVPSETGLSFSVPGTIPGSPVRIVRLVVPSGRWRRNPIFEPGRLAFNLS